MSLHLLLPCKSLTHHYFSAPLHTDLPSALTLSHRGFSRSCALIPSEETQRRRDKIIKTIDTPRLGICKAMPGPELSRRCAFCVPWLLLWECPSLTLWSEGKWLHSEDMDAWGKCSGRAEICQKAEGSELGWRRKGRRWKRGGERREGGGS